MDVARHINSFEDVEGWMQRAIDAKVLLGKCWENHGKMGTFTLRCHQTLLENGPFMDDFLSLKAPFIGDFPATVAMFDYQRVLKFPERNGGFLKM